jgi:hypothetical protein
VPTALEAPDQHVRRQARLDVNEGVAVVGRRTPSYAPYASRDSTEGAIRRSENAARESRFNDAREENRGLKPGRDVPPTASMRARSYGWFLPNVLSTYSVQGRQRIFLPSLMDPVGVEA